MLGIATPSHMACLKECMTKTELEGKCCVDKAKQAMLKCMNDKEKEEML